MNDNLARQLHYQRGKQEMTPTHEKLMQVLLFKGNGFIAEICGIAESEASRKISGENGFKLKQLADLFDALGVQLAGKEDLVITRKKYQSLVELSKEQLLEESETLDGYDRRAPALSVVESEK